MGTYLVLASGSPRRKALLQQIGVAFDVHPVDMDESMHPGEAVIAHVKRLALEKARAGYQQACRQIKVCAALGADTVVDIDGEVLGKPADSKQAAAFLARLSGRKHKVHTAVAVVTSNTELMALSSSEVEFARISEQQINSYVKTGEPLDKAGAYAIQGRGGQFVVHLNGSYSGVMGLPLYETVKLLSACGVACSI
ncbi:MAG: Maf family protein [Gammaproteobacteria bacterium]